MSRQRQVVLEEVRKVRSHPTADEVYEMVRLRLPKVSLGTVYRNLDRLTREGFINTIEGPGQRRYDGELMDHAHLRCTRCGVVLDIDLKPLPPDELSRMAGEFQVSSCRMELSGVCGGCREVQGERSREKGEGKMERGGKISAECDSPNSADMKGVEK